MWRWAQLGISVLVLAGAVASAAPAVAATPRFHRVVAQTRTVATDGERFVVYRPLGGGDQLVIDTRRRVRYKLTLEAGCAWSSPVVAGRLLVGCSDGSDRLVDLRTRTSSIPPSDFVVDGETRRANYETFGRRWLQGTVACSSGPNCLAFLDRLSGTRRVVDQPVGPPPPYDLDVAEPVPLRYCDPFADKPVFPVGGRDGSYLWFFEGSDARGFQLVLGRCGGGRRVLARNLRAQARPWLSDRRISWVPDATASGRYVYSLDLRTRKRLQLRRPLIGERISRAFHTHDAVFVGISGGEGFGDESVTLFHARLR